MSGLREPTDPADLIDRSGFPRGNFGAGGDSPSAQPGGYFEPRRDPREPGIQDSRPVPGRTIPGNVAGGDDPATRPLRRANRHTSAIH